MIVLPFCLAILSVAGAEQAPSKAAFAKRVAQGDLATPERILSRHLEEDFELHQHPNFRRRHSSLFNKSSKQRKNKQDFTKEENCDQALLTCLPEDKCADCFRFLYSEQVDWGRITPETSCDEVTKFLADKEYCDDMHEDKASSEAFCKSFDACAVWEEDDTDDDDDEPKIDCDALTECNWEGMVKSFIGDGTCQDSMGGCYNSAICNYDGGDCCEDTCKPTEYVDCGHDGYACRNPNSTNCDPFYTLGCEHDNEVPDENNPDPADTKCKDDEVKYRLVMYDSFGDGWDQTEITITQGNKKSDTRFKGGLESGSSGSRYVCLPSASTCMHVDVSGGEWGNEVSWELKPMTNGAPSLAAGGSPMSCDFAVGGKACDNTCDGKANLEPNNDPDYKEFKEMYTCIEDKCTIQVGVCEKDETCSECLAEDKADFCYGSDAFLAVVDCTMCQCTDRKESDFCHQKLSPGLQPAPNNNDGDGRQPDGSPRACSPGETMKGSNAVLTFAQCTAFDQVSMLVTNYDSNNFGLLDQFEACAHSFAGEEDHGGHTALGCMQILVNAMSDDDDEADEDDSAKAISALAELLYHNATGFCECAASASADCPLCSSFVHIKTLLYESLDACQSLDEIDCDAWTEFHKPCKSNFADKFGDTVDFSKDGACEYVQEGCGGAGPFPAFRRLDCGDEADTSTSKAAWDFYKQYAEECLPDEPVKPDKPDKPDDKPVKPPVSPPTPNPTVRAPTTPKPVPDPTPRPTGKPYIPSGPSGGNSGPTKPYVPPEDGSDSSYSPPSSGGGSHLWRNFFIVAVLGGAGFLYYKRRTDAFSFVRYRNTRNYAGGESEMYSAPYSGLTMDSGSGAFQPPSLPPTPSAIDQQW